MVVGVDVHPPFATSLSFSSPPLPLALLSPFFIIRFRPWGFNLVGWRFFFIIFLALLFWIPNADRILFAYCAAALLGVSLLAYRGGSHVLLMHRKHGVPGGCFCRSYTIIAAQLVARIEHVTVDSWTREIAIR